MNDLKAAVAAYEAAQRARDEVMWVFTAAQSAFRQQPIEKNLLALGEASTRLFVASAKVDRLFAEMLVLRDAGKDGAK